MNAESCYPKIKIQQLYDSIIEYYGWQDYADSKVKLLRNKYNTLQRKLVLCDREDFKGTDRKNYIPVADVPIVRAILIEAMDDSGHNPIYDWFNDNLDTSIAEAAINLYTYFESVIVIAAYEAGVDQVTLDEWLGAVSASINHSTAENTWRLKQNLEAFRNNSLALDCTISVGDIIVTDEDGSRKYAMRGEHPPLDIHGKTIESIMDAIQTQDDYFAVFNQILELFNEHAKASIINKIEVFAKAKDAFDLNKADDGVEPNSLASEYRIWYQRIHDFLASNPEVCERIEKKTHTTGLAEFFRMADR